MHDFYRHLAHLFCCVPLRKSEDHTTASLSTLQVPASALSVPLPHETVPHSSSQSNTDDAQALHHIFSSSSSVRGYHTAATTPGYIPTSCPSLDQDFRFGSNIPTKRVPTPLERLGHHIRQKLSEGRLSRSNSKQDVRSPDVGLHHIHQPSPLKAEPDSPLGISHSTTGLTDILASRTASQGGYDADANILATPVVRSNAGTIKVSAGFVKQALEKLKPGNESAASPPPPSATPSDANLPVAVDSASHPRVQSSPFPTTPSKKSFTATLQVGRNESPTDVLRRLSFGIANGTIRAPETPELRAIRSPSVNEIESNWRLTAPPRSSSLKVLDQDLQSKMKRLSAEAESVKRDSVLSVNEDKKRTSLISELDPALVECMTRYAERISSEEAASSMSDGKHLEHILDVVPAQASKRVPVQSHDEEDNVPTLEVRSLTEADSESVHLFNMRISQRLASQSQLPFQSTDTSKNASTRSLAVNNSGFSSHDYARESIVNVARYPTWIATENNRQPSDPQTRKLFESEPRLTRPHPSAWKTVTSVHSGSSSIVARTKDPRSEQDDASSLYWSDGEIVESQINSPEGRSRQNSLQNPHSLAVAGRSVSARVSSSLANTIPRQVSSAGQRRLARQRSQDKIRASEETWLGNTDANQRGRSVSMPQNGNHSQRPSPTPMFRRLRGNTSTAENISEISLDRVLDQTNQGLTEISTQEVRDRRNEQLSEINHEAWSVSDAVRTRARALGISPSRVYDGQLRGHSRGDSGIPSSISDHSLGSLRECGTSLWRRAFKTALEEPYVSPTGEFLTATRFDQDSRLRRSVNISASDSVLFFKQRGPSLSQSRRTQSVGGSRRSSAPSELDAHQRLCSATKTALPRASPAVNVLDSDLAGVDSQTMKEKSKTGKRSILELGRRFASVESAGDDERKSATLTPIKDLFGVWARFPSYTRAERNGSATAKDDVRVKDFEVADEVDGSWRYPVLANIASPRLAPSGGSAMKRLRYKASRRLDKAETKSMTLQVKTSMMLSPAERARQARKGLVGRWRRLYRSTSSELRKYANAHRHRSSLSVGDMPDYPDLECLPGEGLFKVADFQKRQDVDGSADLDYHSRKVLTSVYTPVAVSGNGETGDWRPDTVEWGRIYGECVGSLSALKSDTDGDMLSMTFSDRDKEAPDARVGDGASMELRDTTSECRRQLGIEQERMREELIDKIGKIGKSQDGVGDASRREKGIEGNEEGHDDKSKEEKDTRRRSRD